MKLKIRCTKHCFFALTGVLKDDDDDDDDDDDVNNIILI